MSDPVVRARLVAGALGATPVILALIAAAIPAGRPSAPALAFPAALVGLLAPAVAYRVYGGIRDGRGEAVPRFLRATVAALAVTEGAAIFGCVSYVLSREVVALAGVLSHLILAGAVWPTPTRLLAFGSDGGGTR